MVFTLTLTYVLAYASILPMIILAIRRIIRELYVIVMLTSLTLN
jgi:hypothetical protein